MGVLLRGLWGVSQSDVCREGTGSSCAAHKRAQGPCLGCILGTVPAGAEPAVVTLVGLGTIPCLAGAQGRAGPTVVTLVGLGAAWGPSPAWPLWLCRGCSDVPECVPESRGAVAVPAPLCRHCGMRDEPKIHPAGKGCQPGVLPVLPIPGVSGQALDGIGVSSPVSLPGAAPGTSSAGRGMDGEHPQPRCFSPPRAIPSLFRLEYPVAAGGEVLFPLSLGVFLQTDIPAGLVTTENPRGFCL